MDVAAEAELVLRVEHFKRKMACISEEARIIAIEIARCTEAMNRLLIVLREP